MRLKHIKLINEIFIKKIARSDNKIALKKKNKIIKKILMKAKSF